MSFKKDQLYRLRRKSSSSYVQLPASRSQQTMFKEFIERQVSSTFCTVKIAGAVQSLKQSGAAQTPLCLGARA